MRHLARILTILFLFAFCLGAHAEPSLVNLNKADPAAFQQNLIGIGPKKAEAIVKYRRANGRFKSVNDLVGVSGIGPKLVKKNKKFLSLSRGIVRGDAKKYQVAKKAAQARRPSKRRANPRRKKIKPTSSTSSKKK